MKCRIAEAIFIVGIDVECYGDISFSGQGYPIVKMMQSDFMLPFYGAVMLSSPDSMKTHKAHVLLGSLLMKRGGGSWCRARVVSCVQVVQAGSHESQASGQRGSLL